LWVFLDSGFAACAAPRNDGVGFFSNLLVVSGERAIAFRTQLLMFAACEGRHAVGRIAL
jgi:hypothetical protein